MGSFWQLQTPKWLTLWGEDWSQNGWLTVLQRRTFCSSLLQNFSLCTKDTRLSFIQSVSAAVLQHAEDVWRRKRGCTVTVQLKWTFDYQDSSKKSQIFIKYQVAIYFYGHIIIVNSASRYLLKKMENRRCRLMMWWSIVGSWNLQPSLKMKIGLTHSGKKNGHGQGNVLKFYLEWLWGTFGFC